MPCGGRRAGIFAAAPQLHGQPPSSARCASLRPAAGGPITIVELGGGGSGDAADGGGAKTTVLGHDLGAGQKLQHVVPPGVWFGAANDGPSWALVGCTVAPGFEFSAFEMGDAADLGAQFPGAAAWIQRLMGDSG